MEDPIDRFGSGIVYNLNMDFTCRPVVQSDMEAWLSMGSKLWPKYTPEELRPTFTKILASDKEAAFLAESTDRSPIGFVNVSLRNSYVAGAKNYPVAYLEGIFVEEEFRSRGVGQSLLQISEKWAMEKGCTEMGSDAELENTGSHGFHEANGFKETERLVCYIKPLK